MCPRFFLYFRQLLLSTLTLHFVRVRCLSFYVLSLSLNKERTKENQPKGLEPFGNPQCATKS